MQPPTRFIVPVLAFGLFAGCVMVLIRSPKPGLPADAVEAEIHKAILRQADEDGGEDGGPVGPWWVAAESIDETSGRLLNFRLAGGDIRVAARSARLVIDPENDTFSFELFDVALTRLPDSKADSGGTVLALEHHVLGPMAYGCDIESDVAEVLADAGADDPH